MMHIIKNENKRDPGRRRKTQTAMQTVFLLQTSKAPTGDYKCGWFT
jgi:hypothetical protein